jgi:hypothetical protein
MQFRRSSMANLKPNRLVEKLAQAMDVPSPAATIRGGTPGALAGSRTPEIVTFVGYLGDTVNHDDIDWRILYLDSTLRDCLFIKEDGILLAEVIKPPDAPPDGLNVLWVKGEAAVRHASGLESADAQFLTGEFTQAADFEASPTGGTLSAATGVFCEGRSPGCCRGCTARTR